MEGEPGYQQFRERFWAVVLGGLVVGGGLLGALAGDWRWLVALLATVAGLFAANGLIWWFSTMSFRSSR